MSTTNIATSTKPQLFICPSCSKSFTRKDYLYRHEKNHSQVKPFKCDQCNLSFTRSDLLTKHYKSKSHQRLKNELTDSYRSTVNSGSGKSIVGNNSNSNPKQASYKVEKRSSRLVSSSTSSIMNDTLLNQHAPRPNQFNKEREIKEFRRLGIPDFLNRHFNDERIPAPPPQPSIILPAIPSNCNDNPTLGSANIFMNQSQEKGKAVESKTYNSAKEQQNPNSHYLNSHDHSVPTPNTSMPGRDGISGGGSEVDSNAPPGIIDNDLLWLFNDITPVDNLFWLFGEISPLENSGTESGSGNKLANSNDLNPTTSSLAEPV